MEKPKCIRNLAAIAAALIGLNIILNFANFSNPAFSTSLFGYCADISDFTLTNFCKILIFTVVFLVLPLLITCICTACSKKASHSKGVTTLVLAAIFNYGFGWLSSNLLNRAMIETARSFGTFSVSVLQCMNSLRNLTSILNSAGFVIICCAAAIEIYTVRTHTDK